MAAMCSSRRRPLGDFRAKEVFDFKVKKTQHDLDTIQLVENPDILSQVAERKKDQVVVGFAAETNQVVDYAEEKLQRKKLDVIVANDVTQAGAGFDSDTNIVTILKRGGGRREVPLAQKRMWPPRCWTRSRR